MRFHERCGCYACSGISKICTVNSTGQSNTGALHEASFSITCSEEDEKVAGLP